MSSGQPGSRLAWGLCAAAVILGGAVRLASGWNDFWLDEVWTWMSVQQLASPLEVFTSIHHSNNNHLNTLLLQALGNPEQWIVYRLPSLAAGTATIALAAALAARRGRLEAVLAAWLTASCFALLHFSSEARGYALAVAVALGAQLLLRRDLERPTPASALGFGLCVLLGVLSHLVWLFYYAGALLWSGLVLARRADSGGRPVVWLASMARLHALPALALPILYAVDLRHLDVGSGYPTDYALLAARTVGFALGLPVVRELALPYAVLAAAVVALGLWLCARRGDDAWIVHAVTIAIAPAIVITALHPEVVAVRYFLIGIAFTLILTADVLAQALRAGGAQRVLAVAALAVFLLGNGWHTARFLVHGRGGFSAAVEAMAAATPGNEILVASDHDFRNRVVLEFHARQLPDARRLVYVPRDGRGGVTPDWFVTHRAQRPERTPPRLRDAAGERYHLVADFDHAAISGFYWALYRSDRLSDAPLSRAAPAPGSPPRTPAP